MMFVESRGYGTYNIKEVEKKQKGETNADEETGEEEEAPILLVTHVNKIIHSIFSNVEKHINNQQIYDSNGLYAHKSYISKIFKAATSENKGVLHARGTTRKDLLMKLWNCLCLNVVFHKDNENAQ